MNTKPATQQRGMVRGEVGLRASGLPGNRATQGFKAALHGGTAGQQQIKKSPLITELRAKSASLGTPPVQALRNHPGLGYSGPSRGRSAPLPGFRSGSELRGWEMPLEDRPQLHLLVMDEDAEVRGACVEVARRMGFTVAHATDPASAYAIVRTQRVDVMLLDLRGTETRTRGASGAAGGGLSLLEELRSLHPEIAVVVTTSSGTVASAVDAMRMGAEDYLTKPFALDELVRVLERTSRKTHANQESRMLRERLRNQRGGGPLVGRSPEMEKLYRILSKVSHSTHPVLILGESGTGKELVARSIHFNGPLASKPFVPVDCGSLAPELIEGELFGYVRGAAPAAVGGALAGPRDGLLASADGGTVFLDEIGELPLDLQAKLLRALQERAVYPLGGTHSVPISARVLAATNQELTAMVDQGKFRRDLYFRLNVVSLRIPPLRQRREDIPDLTEYFLDKLRKESGAKYTVSDEALRVLAAYDWPGNVRELESVVERACAMSSGPVMHVVDLASPLQQVAAAMRADQNPVGADEEVLQAHSRIQPIAEMERRAILGTIRQLKGDKLLAAKLLGIGKTTLYRKLKEYGIDEWSESGLRN